MEQKLYFLNSKGTKLCGMLSAFSNDTTQPVIVFVHGFTSNKNTKSWLQLTEMFNKKNIATFRIDLFAHGESEGNFEDLTISEAVDDILQAIQFLKLRGYTKIGLIGSSFGGMASIMATSKSRDIIVLGLKSPVSDYEEVWMRRRTPEQIKKWQEKGIAEYEDEDGNYKLRYTFYEDFKNNEAYKVAPKIMIPTIIVHGDADSVVPVQESIKISQLTPNCKLVLVKGADHWYKGEGELDQLVHALYEFFISNL